MRGLILAILFGFLMGIVSPLGAAPIGFQGNPIQFPYATAPLGPGFQNTNFQNTVFIPNRFFFDNTMGGPGFQPTPDTFPVEQNNRSRFFNPNRVQQQPMDFTQQQRGF